MLKQFSFAVVWALIATAVASAQISFERKYNEGSQFKVQKEDKTKQSLVLNGINIDTAASTFSIMKTSIGRRAADGRLDVETKVDSMQSEASFPGGLTIRFDSSDPDKKAAHPALEPILEKIRAAAKVPITSELDAKNQVESVKLPDGEFEKLPESAKTQFTSDWLKKRAEQMMAVLPEKPVKKGDTWDVSSDLNAGDGNMLGFRTRYEYVGTIEQNGKVLDKITSKTTDVSYTINGNATTQLKSSDLKVVESSGTLLFDRDIGDVVFQESKVQVAGSLALFINGQELGGTVDLTIESKSTRQK